MFFSDYLSQHYTENAASDEIEEKNVLYSPSCFDVISSMMPYYPMWSCLLGDDELCKAHSNAVVESHFRQLKLTTLQK